MIRSQSASVPSRTDVRRFEQGGGWFVAPFFLLFTAFSIFGLVFTLVVSFCRWDPFQGSGALVFRGLRGYGFVISDPNFLAALLESLTTAFPILLIEHVVAFTLGYALYLMFRRSLTTFGMLMFLPYLAIPVGLISSLILF